jgi:hypothetical protein
VGYEAKNGGLEFASSPLRMKLRTGGLELAFVSSPLHIHRDA